MWQIPGKAPGEMQNLCSSGRGAENAGYADSASLLGESHLRSFASSG